MTNDECPMTKEGRNGRMTNRRRALCLIVGQAFCLPASGSACPAKFATRVLCELAAREHRLESLCSAQVRPVFLLTPLQRPAKILFASCNVSLLPISSHWPVI